MPRLLYFDCFSGASGDMLLGAFVDAGLPIEALRDALGSLAIDGVEVRAERVTRSGIGATKIRVLTGAPASTRADREAPQGHASSQTGHHHGHHDHRHDEHHHHADESQPRAAAATAHAHHHEHRSLADIGRLIDRSALSPAARVRAKELFQRLGAAEAEIHQVPLDRVHLHEVGALDSIVDIVGAVFALEWFGADRVMASPLNVGGGFVHCEHGRLPVPAPATAHLLRGVPVYSDGDSELVTPTGALVVGAYATAFGALPPMTIDRIGYGAGDRDPAQRPNVLRLFVGEMAAGGHHEQIGVLQCEIDDMNPQMFGSLMDRLFEAGAVDVFYQPVQMKKNRPGTLVTVLAPPPLRGALTTILFAESTSIGVRYVEADRECLERERIEVPTPWGPVRIKVARRAGAIMNAQPEFDDCLRAADRHKVSVKLVHAEAVRAWMERER